MKFTKISLLVTVLLNIDAIFAYYTCPACIECYDCDKYPDMAKYCPSTCKGYYWKIPEKENPVEPEPYSCDDCIECVDCDEHPEAAIHCPFQCKKKKPVEESPIETEPVEPEPYGCDMCIECVDCDEHPEAAIHCPFQCIKKKPVEENPVEENPVETESPLGYDIYVCPACVNCYDCDKYPKMAKHCPSTCKGYYWKIHEKENPVETEPVEPEPYGCDDCIECVDCDEHPEAAIHCPFQCIKKKPEDDQPVVKDDDDCFALDLGYKCCNSNKVVYTDESGNWGIINNNEWCGIGGSSKKNEKNNQEQEMFGDYPYCSECKTNYNDKDGDWYYSNNNWCKVDEKKCNCKSVNGYQCCKNSSTKVIYTDSTGKWGVENNEWCIIH
eukprot:jgi/Orpsp1_1/1175630/evm.model.c7180000054622.1